MDWLLHTHKKYASLDDNSLVSFFIYVFLINSLNEFKKFLLGVRQSMSRLRTIHSITYEKRLLELFLFNHIRISS